MLKYVLFDLDGTITKSEEGIIKSVEYAIEKSGYEICDRDTLKKFIGPPLINSFMSYCNMSYDEAVKAVAYYRERYVPVGMYECEVFDGIENIFDELHKNNVIISTATSKPEGMAVEVLRHFGLDKKLDFIIGSDLSEKTTKTDVIKEAFKRIPVNEDDKKYTVMVGDTEFDIKGAKECGIKSIGVGYGYGKKESILLSEPEWFSNSTGELKALFLDLCK